jgi:hypothetical protein
MGASVAGPRNQVKARNASALAGFFVACRPKKGRYIEIIMLSGSGEADNGHQYIPITMRVHIQNYSQIGDSVC